MDVRIAGTTGDDGLRLVLADRLPRLPAGLVVYPDAGRRRFATEPDGHCFAASRGDYGYLREVRVVARQYLLGYLMRGTAEARLARALAAWSRATLI